eukprot:jgi/Botrbrau1/3665/Bobra.0204s0054.2
MGNGVKGFQGYARMHDKSSIPHIVIDCAQEIETICLTLRVTKSSRGRAQIMERSDQQDEEIEVGTERCLQTSKRAAPGGPRLSTFYRRASQVRTQLVLRTPLPWFVAPADGCHLEGFPVRKAFNSSFIRLIQLVGSHQVTLDKLHVFTREGRKEILQGINCIEYPAKGLLQKNTTGLFWASVCFELHKDNITHSSLA